MINHLNNMFFAQSRIEELVQQLADQEVLSECIALLEGLLDGKEAQIAGLLAVTVRMERVGCLCTHDCR